ncbi:hypothetical protein BDR07DRAFT_1383822 [Suillus spraguei]|nr:hypothetical protein BDR07DRAFT_1383822 [Suillus spraguei]
MTQIDIPKEHWHNEEKEEKLLESVLLAMRAQSWWTNLPQLSMFPVPSSHGTSGHPDRDHPEGNQGGHRFAGSKPRKSGSENVGSTPGCINLSPAWFQQGHENLPDPEVSTSLKGPSSENILKAIARPAAIASAALRVMHPQQYFTGLRALSHLGDKALSKELPQMPETCSTGHPCLTASPSFPIGKPPIIETFIDS